MNPKIRQISSGIFSIILLGPLALIAQSAAADDTHSKPKVVLVELFTSEGCSDCPPADELLRQVDQKTTKSGQIIIGVSEHVTYWNSLGWADPFSLNIFTRRQEAYGAKFGLDSVYTPQMVVNGTQQLVGSDSTRLSQVIQGELQQPSSITVRVISTKVSSGQLNISYAATGDFPPQGPRHHRCAGRRR